MATVPGYRDVLTAYGATNAHTPIRGERESEEHSELDEPSEESAA